MTDTMVERSSERPRAEICGGALCRRKTGRAVRTTETFRMIEKCQLHSHSYDLPGSLVLRTMKTIIIQLQWSKKLWFLHWTSPSWKILLLEDHFLWRVRVSALDMKETSNKNFFFFHTRIATLYQRVRRKQFICSEIYIYQCKIAKHFGIQNIQNRTYLWRFQGDWGNLCASKPHNIWALGWNCMRNIIIEIQARRTERQWMKECCVVRFSLLLERDSLFSERSFFSFQQDNNKPHST